MEILIILGVVLGIYFWRSKKGNQNPSQTETQTGLSSINVLFSKINSSDVFGTLIYVVFSVILGVLALWLFAPDGTFSFLEKWKGSIGLFVIAVVGFGFTKAEYLKNSSWTWRYICSLTLFLGSSFLFLIKLLTTQ